MTPRWRMCAPLSPLRSSIVPASRSISMRESFSRSSYCCESNVVRRRWRA